MSPTRLEALITAGLVHSDRSPARRLTANEAIAREAERQLGTARIDALVAAAGSRMLDDEAEWLDETPDATRDELESHYRAVVETIESVLATTEEHEQEERGPEVEEED